MKNAKTESDTDTLKSIKATIGFVDIEHEVSLKAIDLEARLVFRQNPALRHLFLSTPNLTVEVRR